MNPGDLAKYAKNDWMQRTVLREYPEHAKAIPTLTRGEMRHMIIAPPGSMRMLKGIKGPGGVYRVPGRWFGRSRGELRRRISEKLYPQSRRPGFIPYRTPPPRQSRLGEFIDRAIAKIRSI